MLEPLTGTNLTPYTTTIHLWMIESSEFDRHRKSAYLNPKLSYKIVIQNHHFFRTCYVSVLVEIDSCYVI